MSDETVNLRAIVDGVDDVHRAVDDIVQVGFVVDDIEAEVARLSAEGVAVRIELVDGPGGSQALALDPSGSYVEPFQPGGRP
jgi:predicted enzyme related to lactoylglutathione lyase